MKKLSSHWIWCGISLILLGVLYLLICRPHISGLYYDDGIYLQGARELALGHGYRLASEPGLPAIVKYPPLFPFIVSFIWRLFPSFPDNLPVLKAFNILLTLSGLGVFYHFCRSSLRLPQANWFALAFVLYWGLNPVLARGAVDMLSEPLYFLLSVSALSLATSWSQQSEAKLSKGRLMCLAALSIAAFYTRTIGISLVFALGIWLWVQYGKRTAVIFSAVCFLAVLPWLLWGSLQPTGIIPVGQFYSVPFNLTYWHEMQVVLLQGQGWLPLVTNILYAFSCRVFTTIFPLVEGLRLAIIVVLSSGCLLILLAGWVFYRLWQEKKLSPVHGYVVIYAFFCLLWPFPEHYNRFLALILPMVAWVSLAYVLETYQVRRHTLAIVVAIIGLGFLNFQSGFRGYPLPVGDRLATNAKQSLWKEYQQFFQDLNYRTQPNDVIWSFYSAMYPLYVHRRMISRNVVNSPSIFIGKSIAEDQELIFNAVIETLRKNHVTHLLLEPKVDFITLTQWEEGRTKALLEKFPDKFTLEYQSESGVIKLYRFQG